jgi:hypothetical protein
LLAKLTANVKLPDNSPMTIMNANPDYVRWMSINMWIGVGLGAALLVFGIGLLFLQNWARIGSIAVAVIAMVFVTILAIVGWPFVKQMMDLQTQGKHISPGMIQGIAMLILIAGLIFRLAYPVLLLIFMTRSKAIEACQPEAEQPASPA